MHSRATSNGSHATAGRRVDRRADWTDRADQPINRSIHQGIGRIGIGGDQGLDLPALFGIRAAGVEVRLPRGTIERQGGLEQFSKGRDG